MEKKPGRKFRDPIAEQKAAVEALAEANRTMDAMLVKIGEQVLDIKFLALRSEMAGTCSFAPGRDTGVSANSIVSIAYGLTPLDAQEFPTDLYDLEACQRMIEKLPPHRLSQDVHEAMFRASQFIKARNEVDLAATGRAGRV